MNLSCRELVDQLLDYVAGELPPEVVERIRQHLDQCPPCVTYVETYRVTVRVTRQLRPVPVPPQVLEKLKAAMGQPAE